MYTPKKPWDSQPLDDLPKSRHDRSWEMNEGKKRKDSDTSAGSQKDGAFVHTYLFSIVWHGGGPN